MSEKIVGNFTSINVGTYIIYGFIIHLVDLHVRDCNNCFIVAAQDATNIERGGEIQAENRIHALLKCDSLSPSEVWAVLAKFTSAQQFFQYLRLLFDAKHFHSLDFVVFHLESGGLVPLEPK